MIVSVSDEKFMEFKRILGLPDRLVSFEIAGRVGALVSISCEMLPDDDAMIEAAKLLSEEGQ